MNNLISFPKANIFSGEYQLNFDVKRKAFSSDDYNIIHESKNLPAEISVYLNNNTNENINFSAEENNGHINLSNYPSIKNNIVAELENNGFVDVNFKITANYKEKEIYFDPIVRTIKDKTDDEKEQEAKHFAEETAEKLMRKITPNTGKSSYAAIKSYNIEYDLINMRYTIPMTANWTGATWLLGPDRYMYVEGVLKVNEDGSNPEFERNNVSQYAQKAINVYGVTFGTILILEELDKQGAFD